MKVERACFLMLVVLACGAPNPAPVQLPPPPCNVTNIPPEWECCDDDGLLCSAVSAQMYVCSAHKWVDMTDSACARIENDPKRPELKSYPGLCSHPSTNEWSQCVKTRTK
jgi:hypothetical protein